MSIPIVTVKQGKLKGAVIQNILGSSSYYAFRGIPFATPPVGELRFKVSTYILTPFYLFIFKFYNIFQYFQLFPFFSFKISTTYNQALFLFNKYILLTRKKFQYRYRYRSNFFLSLQKMVIKIP